MSLALVHFDQIIFNAIDQPDVYKRQGWAWVEQDDNDSYDATAIHICGPDGTHKTLDPRTLEETLSLIHI